MNYFYLINAFYESLEQKPLRPPAIALWHALANIANKAGWPATFTVSITALSNKAGLNRNAVERARNTLAQMGYITWKSRGGSLAAIYELTNLYIKNTYKNDAQVVVQTDAQSDAQVDVQSDAIIKQELELKQELNITTDREVFCLSNLEQKEFDAILEAVQLEALEPQYLQADMAEYIKAMYYATAIWANKQRIPQPKVRLRMRQLDTANVQWAIDQLQYAGEISNPRSYMQAILYNAPVDYDTAMSIDVARSFPKIQGSTGVKL